jgi:CDP-diacylglycerol--glycerol-3-phosphate 3-phosphatidyltransferase
LKFDFDFKKVHYTQSDAKCGFAVVLPDYTISAVRRHAARTLISTQRVRVCTGKTKIRNRSTILTRNCYHGGKDFDCCNEEFFMNVPNTLTIFRVFFAVITFILIGLHRYDFALLFFLLAVATDFLDGWWARHFKQITVFGRVMDPFADKFLICGVFTCLLTIPELTFDRGGYPYWLMLQAWMVVVILGRELLVTSLRAFVEAAGGDFSAKWIGKWKMALQCIAVAACLLYLAGGAEWNIVNDRGTELMVQQFYRPDVAAQTKTVLAYGLDYVMGTRLWRKYIFFAMLVSLWMTIGITLLSGLDYCINAARMLRKQHERRLEKMPNRGT